MERNPNDDMGRQGAERENMGGSTGGASGAGGAGGLSGAGGYGNDTGYGNSGGTTGSAGYGAGGYGADASTSIGEAGGSMGARSTGATPPGMAGSAPTNTGVAGTAPLADTYSSSGTAGQEGGRHLRDDARERAREALGDVGNRARDFKHRAERTLADRLEQGASRLRQRGRETPASTGGADMGSAAYATAGTGTAAGSMAAERGNKQAEKLAEGMDATAKWLREGDLKETIQEQARTNPGRTLLVALGMGYLLGKAIRRR